MYTQSTGFLSLKGLYETKLMFIHSILKPAQNHQQSLVVTGRKTRVIAISHKLLCWDPAQNEY